MTFSVLMSVYHKDCPDHLKAALESIYEKQTKKPDEIVIVFDGPLNDALYEVLNQFREGKEHVVRFLPQEINRGLGEALRIGSYACTSDFIFRMDSDDVSLPQRFEWQSNYLLTHPEVDVLGTDMAEFEENPEEENKRICSFPEDHDSIVRFAKQRNPICHMTVCIRRSALMACGSYQPLPLTEDYYLWLRMMIAGYRFANLHRVSVLVRTGNGMYSRRSATVQVKSWKSIQELMLKHHMVSRFAAFRNMWMVRVFVRIPPRVKKWIYAVFWRKPSNGKVKGKTE